MPTRIAIIFLTAIIIAGFIGSQRMLRGDQVPHWLPSYDYSPGSPLYPLDRLGERLDLLLARRGSERLELSLVFADEKFHEALDMVRAEEAGFAWIAVGLHRDYLERAAREIDALPTAEATARRRRFIDKILSQLDTLGQHYHELPDQIRAFSLVPLVSNCLDMFDFEVGRLPTEYQQAYIDARIGLEAMAARMREADR